MGIEVIHEPLGDLLGYYSKHFRIKFIHINENIEERKGIFVCSHELGHAILHPNSNTPFLKSNTFFSTKRIEIEANKFAMELIFNNLGDDVITINEVIEEYGIPKQFLSLKS